jgi:uncharacterized membrane protein
MDVAPEKTHRTGNAQVAPAEQLKHVLSGVHFPKFLHEKHGPIVNVNNAADEQLTFGQKVADGVATAMGSWGFIIGQASIMVLWVILNVIGWVYKWDPYPFILLNLAMSAQAAFATPLIMMSQNRQATKDRLTAENDYKTDVKGEEEICHIMEHMDHQDGLILQIVQRLEEQAKHLAEQEKLTLQIVQRLEEQNQQFAIQHQDIIKRLEGYEAKLAQHNPPTSAQE